MPRKEPRTPRYEPRGPRKEMSLLLVFKGGPNHGLIMADQEAVDYLRISENGYLPPIGLQFTVVPAILRHSGNAVDPDRVAAAWRKIGLEEPAKVVYEIESIEDDIVVLAFLGEA